MVFFNHYTTSTLHK